ncbi:MAG TPA: YIP1 family protein [Kouleothrix sp.]|mgnify:CR=1 FL=1|uniref:YIP1 family protein n=1 Tax=Kouleothrix sp. TaxID=2779161 RepID=UPI002C4ACF33|nr:YIP1 family protein [Kouleothrix sp.]HRC74076.1 YIP1 family protein [Kouleothrix sp.]
MFQQMLNASRAILLRPSVAVFEEHERNDLGWATIYIAISTVVAAILGAISFVLNRPYLEQQLRDLQNRLGDQPLPPLASTFMGGQNITGAIISSLFFTIIAFFLWTLIVYALGRLFGGTGAFGELAYDIALFWGPIAVIRGLIGLISIGPVAPIGGLVGLLVGLYNIYLSWLSVRSGMNLSAGKAAAVIAIPIIVLALGCCLVFGALMLVIVGASRQ